MENYESGSLRGRKLVQVALTTRDLDKSRRFYQDTLGLTLLFEAGTMLFFDLGGTRLLIGSENAAGEPQMGIRRAGRASNQLVVPR